MVLFTVHTDTGHRRTPTDTDGHRHRRFNLSFLQKCLLFVGFEVYEGFHSNWNKRTLAVAMVALAHMCIRWHAWPSTCGSSWHHKCMGIFFAHPLRTLMKWSLNVPMDLSHKFLQWSSGGTSLYVIFSVDPSASFVDYMAISWVLCIDCQGFGV